VLERLLTPCPLLVLQFVRELALCNVKRDSGRVTSETREAWVWVYVAIQHLDTKCFRGCPHLILFASEFVLRRCSNCLT
jgi:hypothetical protein